MSERIYARNFFSLCFGTNFKNGIFGFGPQFSKRFFFWKIEDLFVWFSKKFFGFFVLKKIGNYDFINFQKFLNSLLFKKKNYATVWKIISIFSWCSKKKKKN